MATRPNQRPPWIPNRLALATPRFHLIGIDACCHPDSQLFFQFRHPLISLSYPIYTQSKSTLGLPILKRPSYP
ncbi:hypothetical protein ACTXT7_017060, partial [Hymenolepis weldensis]